MINRELFIGCVRYAPVILSLTSSVKIYLRMTSLTPPSLINWINLALNLLFLGMIYVQGRELHLCYLHRSLCRLALWNYLYYAIFLITTPNKEAVIPIVLFNITITICLIILYEIIRKHTPYNRDDRDCI